MVDVVSLPVGWFLADVRKASERHQQWANSNPSSIVARATEKRAKRSSSHQVDDAKQHMSRDARDSEGSK